jgi:DNA helicase-2/ATP-dependent DNA helicase PcrA
MRYFQNKHDDHSTRQGDLDQLEQIASGHKTRERFLTDISLDPPDTTESGIRKAQRKTTLVLSTIHSAKGRQWKMVRILSVVTVAYHLLFEDIEEERRLCT